MSPAHRENRTPRGPHGGGAAPADSPLLRSLVAPDNLRAAFRRVGPPDRRPGSTGAPHRRADAHDQDRLLDDLARRILSDDYRPGPVRRFRVPKPDAPGRSRTLCVLTRADRVLHAALKQILEPIFEPTFSPLSFGFRPGRSVPLAVGTALRWADSRHESLRAATLDVAECFDSLDHRLLEQALGRRIRERRLRTLLARVLAAGATPPLRHAHDDRPRGVPQGSPLSPLLCNLFLHDLDLRMERESQRGFLYLRYADDILVLASHTSLAEHALRTLRQLLHALRLRPKNPDGTSRPLLDGIPWLGVELFQHAPDGRRTPTDYRIPPDRIAALLGSLDELTSDRPPCPLPSVPARIAGSLASFHGLFSAAHGASEIFRLVDDHVRRRLARIRLPDSRIPIPQISRLPVRPLPSAPLPSPPRS